MLKHESAKLQGSDHSGGGRGGEVKSVAFDELLSAVGGIM